jgi:uncharacterized Tic20 family protein
MAISLSAGYFAWDMVYKGTGYINTISITAITLLGFLLTSMSIFLAICDRAFVIELRKNGKIDNLMRQIFFIILSLFLVVIATLCEPIASSFAYKHYFFIFSLTGLFFCLSTIPRIGYKYYLLLKFS